MKRSLCFITETRQIDTPILDPSVRYRAYHPGELLQDMGHQCSVLSAGRFYESPVFDYDVYIFHRPSSAQKMFPQVVDALRRLNKILIADYDDLIFGDEETALVSSAVKNGTLTQAQAIRVFADNLNALMYFDRVSVSTSPLARRVSEAVPCASVEIVPNLVPPSLLSFHEGMQTYLKKRAPTTIGYFAGTKSHDRDLPVVEMVLHRVLSENQTFALQIVGPVKVPPSLASIPNVTVAPPVDYLHLPGLMAKCSTVIAPLEQSAFNECKSRVKFLEAALSGCRLVASDIPDMRAIGEDHLVIAKSENDWYEALSDPLTQERRTTLAEANISFLAQRQSVAGLVRLGELQ